MPILRHKHADVQGNVAFIHKASFPPSHLRLGKLVLVRQESQFSNNHRFSKVNRLIHGWCQNKHNGGW